MKKNTDNKRRSTMANPNTKSASLPQNIIKEILSKLPIKSLKRFESVSKSWYSLITSPHFIAAHLNRDSYLLIYRFHNPTSSKFSITLMDDKTASCRDVGIPFLDSLFRFPKIVASCNGLICLDISPCYGLGFVFWNIAIKQFKFLPRPRINDVEKSIWMVGAGFGFNQQTNDYKLVRIVSFDCSENNGSSVDIRAEVYSWRSGSWRVLDSKMVEERIGSFVVHEGQNAVALNGSLNWLANGFGYLGNQKSIISFNLGTEEFSRLSIPDIGNGICTKVMEFKGSLALAFYPALNVYPGYGRSINRIEFWVYEDDDDDDHNHGEKQWTKLYSLDLNPSVMGTPMCVHNDCELVLKRVSANCINLAFLNFNNRSIKTLPICSSDFTCQFYDHVDSLVPVSNSGVEEQEQEQEEAEELQIL